MARGYAARYVDPQRREVPGDVYQVVVAGPVETDPDFDHPKTAGIYGASTQPVTVKSVVERDVVLDQRQQNEAAWPYRSCYFGWEDIHAQDGTVLPSAEMRALGATDEYLRLLPKWMDASEFGNGGRLWSPRLPVGAAWATPDEVLEILAHLGVDAGPHVMTSDNVKRARIVEIGSDTPIAFGYLQCGECGAMFGEPQTRVSEQTFIEAALHQAGDDLAVVAQFNGGLLSGYLPALKRRAPTRWSWTSV